MIKRGRVNHILKKGLFLRREKHLLDRLILGVHLSPSIFFSGSGGVGELEARKENETRRERRKCSTAEKL